MHANIQVIPFFFLKVAFDFEKPLRYIVNMNSFQIGIFVCTSHSYQFIKLGIQREISGLFEMNSIKELP